MAIDPAGNSGNGRITIDKRISVSSIIQLLFTIVGGLWMFAHSRRAWLRSGSSSLHCAPTSAPT